VSAHGTAPTRPCRHLSPPAGARAANQIPRSPCLIAFLPATRPGRVPQAPDEGPRATELKIPQEHISLPGMARRPEGSRIFQAAAATFPVGSFAVIRAQLTPRNFPPPFLVRPISAKFNRWPTPYFVRLRDGNRTSAREYRRITSSPNVRERAGMPVPDTSGKRIGGGTKLRHVLRYGARASSPQIIRLTY